MGTSVLLITLAKLHDETNNGIFFETFIWKNLDYRAIKKTGKSHSFTDG